MKCCNADVSQTHLTHAGASAGGEGERVNETRRSLQGTRRQARGEGEKRVGYSSSPDHITGGSYIQAPKLV